MWLRTLLIVVGLVLEIAGLALVSAEDLAPWASRLAASAVAAWNRTSGAVRRLLGRPQVVKGSVHASERVVMRDRARVTRQIDESADLPAKVAFVLDEARRAHERLDDVETQIEAEQVARVNALNDLREEVDAAIRAGIETSRARFIRLRRWGLALLTAGAACLAIANLV